MTQIKNLFLSDVGYIMQVYKMIQVLENNFPLGLYQPMLPKLPTKRNSRFRISNGTFSIYISAFLTTFVNTSS